MLTDTEHVCRVSESDLYSGLSRTHVAVFGVRVTGYRYTDSNVLGQYSDIRYPTMHWVRTGASHNLWTSHGLYHNWYAGQLSDIRVLGVSCEWLEVSAEDFRAVHLWMVDRIIAGHGFRMLWVDDRKQQILCEYEYGDDGATHILWTREGGLSEEVRNAGTGP